ncbi:hypothetical protein M3Y97_01015000 [Aphelenchoides bicaudatus]|nr:hypothetical protein M3Y97_01015000 [Aphelenchoides bicaudatus]
MATFFTQFLSLYTRKTQQTLLPPQDKQKSARSRNTLVGFRRLLFLTITLWFTVACKLTVNAQPVDYEYKVENNQQDPELGPVDGSVDFGNKKCHTECNEGSAGDCLHCLKFIEASELTPDQQTIFDNLEPLPTQPIEEEPRVSPLIGPPLIWSSALRYPRLSLQAQILLRQLEEMHRLQQLRQQKQSNSSPRAHKKDLRVALQRHLKEQDINSLLRNTWVG